jgi:hypothetical protein
VKKELRLLGINTKMLVIVVYPRNLKMKGQWMKLIMQPVELVGYKIISVAAPKDVWIHTQTAD